MLWLSAALSAIAYSVAATVRSETDRVATLADGIRAHYLARGAIDRALLWIVYWSGHRRPDGSPLFFEPPMRQLRMAFPTGEALVELVPEAARLDVNTANPEDLFRLLVTLGANEDRARHITAAILDWRSPAAGPSVFDREYLSIAPTFRGRHASLEQIEDLLLVSGMTPELYYGSYTRDTRNGRLVPRGALRDCLSVWGSPGVVDVNSADPALLVSFGIPPEAVEQIVERRRQRPFLSTLELGALNHPRLMVGGNTIWTLRATARLHVAGGRLSDLSRSVAATVKYRRAGIDDPPYHILRWYDDAWSPTLPPRQP